MFDADGTFDADLSAGGTQALTDGQILAGDLFPTTPIAGKVPNPIPILPPLATVTVTGLRLDVTSDAFTISPTGMFSGNAVFTATAGVADITSLLGGSSQVPLTGNVSPATPFAGTLQVASSGDLTASIPVSAMFMFADPGTGITGSLTLNGTLVSSWACPAPVTYCTAKTNSLGCVPAIGSSGAPRIGPGSGFTVECSNVRNNKAGLLFYSVSGRASAPFQGGTLCVAAPIKRTPAQKSGGSPMGDDCSGMYSFDMIAFALGTGGGNPLPAIADPGAVVGCQWWGRDQGFPAPMNTMLSDGLEFTVCP
jgi:hypothetical protein